jgi:hypothetical protein
MKNTIEIPNELRNRIEAFLADIKSEQRDAITLREKTADELAELEKETTNLISQLPQLRSDALKSSVAIAAFQNAETRQRLITERINELRAQLENMRPISLMVAESILSDLAGFYSESISELIVDILAPFCPRRNAALNVAKNTDAFVQIRSVNGLASRVRMLPPTPGIINQIEGILQRALIGQPLLLEGALETEAGQ